jgi:trans-aconitate methyltransferase
VLVIGAGILFIWLELDDRKTKVYAVSSLPWMRGGIKKVLKEEFIEKGLDPKVIYDLGSGWGALVVDAAKIFPNAKVIGMELSSPAAIYSRIRAFILRRKNVEIIQEDFFKRDLKDADVILFYMLEDILAQLSPKLIEELKPGAMIVSNSFQIKDWQPVRIHHVMEKPFPLRVFIYRVPDSLPKV